MLSGKGGGFVASAESQRQRDEYANVGCRVAVDGARTGDGRSETAEA